MSATPCAKNRPYREEVLYIIARDMAWATVHLAGAGQAWVMRAGADPAVLAHAMAASAEQMPATWTGLVEERLVVNAHLNLRILASPAGRRRVHQEHLRRIVRRLVHELKWAASHSTGAAVIPADHQGSAFDLLGRPVHVDPELASVLDYLGLPSLAHLGQVWTALGGREGDLRPLLSRGHPVILSMDTGDVVQVRVTEGPRPLILLAPVAEPDALDEPVIEGLPEAPDMAVAQNLRALADDEGEEDEGEEEAPDEAAA